MHRVFQGPDFSRNLMIAQGQGELGSQKGTAFQVHARLLQVTSTLVG